jgi:hypothetical protein
MVLMRAYLFVVIAAVKLSSILINLSQFVDLYGNICLCMYRLVVSIIMDDFLFRSP